MGWFEGAPSSLIVAVVPLPGARLRGLWSFLPRVSPYVSQYGSDRVASKGGLCQFGVWHKRLCLELDFLQSRRNGHSFGNILTDSQGFQNVENLTASLTLTQHRNVEIFGHDVERKKVNGLSNFEGKLIPIGQ